MSDIVKSIRSKLGAMTFRARSLADSDRRGRPVSFDTGASLTLTEPERDWLMTMIDRSSSALPQIYPFMPSAGCDMYPALNPRLGPKTMAPLAEGPGFTVRVNDDARKSVVFFGVPTPEGIEYGGTGFMLCDFEEGILIPYIVTARHVAEELDKFRDTGFYIRANRKDGGNPLVEIESAEWAYHPDPTVDLAVANLSLSGKIFDIIYYPLRDKFFGNEDRVAKYGTPNNVICGDPVSIIGLFRLHAGKQRNIPIVHTGHVAALPDPNERIPIKGSRGNSFEAEAYLVEAQTLDGLSGSPVFTKEHLVLTALGSHHGEHAGAYGALVLLGLYVGSWEGHPGEILASDKGLRSDKIRVPVGMGIVVPVQKIIDIVRGDSGLNSYRKKRVEAVKANAARAAATQDLAAGQDAAFPVPQSTDENPTHREDFMRLVGAAARKPAPKD